MSDAQIEALLMHYIDLYREPGWRSYVKDRVNQMATEYPSVFGHFPARMSAAYPTKD